MALSTFLGPHGSWIHKNLFVVLQHKGYFQYFEEFIFKAERLNYHSFYLKCYYFKKF